MEKADDKIKVIATNRKALHDYFVLETYEAGLVLKGTEVKSLREGTVNLKDSYASIKEGELWLNKMHISPYEKGNRYNVEPERIRKLLLHKREIYRLIGKVQEKGLTLVPLKIYFKDGVAKLELALVKGKKLYDKRKSIKEKEAKREISRQMKKRN